jgi:hypothetical protein
MQLFVLRFWKPHVTRIAKKKKTKQKKVDRKYFEAISSQHTANVLVAKTIFFTFQIRIPKSTFLYKYHFKSWRK